MSSSSLRHYALPIAFSGIYVLSASLEMSAIKALHVHGGISLPILVALFLNAACILLVLPYWTARAQVQRMQRGDVILRTTLVSGVSEGTASGGHHLMLPTDGDGGADAAAAAIWTLPRTSCHLNTVRQQAQPSPPPQRSLLPSSPTATARGRRELYSYYALMTVAVLGTTICRTWGVTILPASVASILISSSIAWTLLLSKLILRRRLLPLHYAAAALATTACVTLGLFHQHEQQGNKPPLTRSVWVQGCTFSIGAGFFVALMSVTSSIVTTRWPDHKALRVAEMALVSTAGAELLLVGVAFATGEAPREWVRQLPPAWASGGTQRAVLLAIAIYLPLSKSIVRSSKYAAIALSSALVFELVQGVTGIAAALEAVVLFGEPLDASLGVAIILFIAAFGSYALARSQEVATTRARVSTATTARVLCVWRGVPPHTIASCVEVPPTTVCGDREEAIMSTPGGSEGLPPLARHDSAEDERRLAQMSTSPTRGGGGVRASTTAGRRRVGVASGGGVAAVAGDVASPFTVALLADYEDAASPMSALAARRVEVKSFE